MRHWLVVAVVGCSSPSPQQPAAAVDPPQCTGQTSDAKATKKTPRDGAMTLQLSPGFLDQMAACPKADATPSRDLAVLTAGSVDGRGDCQWSNGVVCHFHLGAEFVDSKGPRPDVGEVHCIFPTTVANSPRVFATHFTCKAGTAVSHGREVHAQQACGTSLLPSIAAAMDRCDPKCCERGTLTDTTDARRQAGKLDVRPDFAVCSTTAELDCSMFANMVGHSANAPVFGAPVENAL